MIVALTGASGSGKTTLVQRLQQALPEVRPLESFTTRPPRASDVAGELIFVSKEEFEQRLAAGEFLWAEQPFGTNYWYGTRHHAVEEALRSGLYVPLLAGTAPRKLYDYCAEHGMLEKVFFLFLYITDEAELRRRLLEDPTRQDIEKRLASAAKENAYAHTSGVPFKIIDAMQSKDAVFEEALAAIRFFQK